MPYALSFLDKSPLDGDESAGSALQRTLALARQAEEAGFNRFWVAEHHNSSRLAGSSPEVLAAFLLASTRRIRIGSGGVMLQHYSSYKVAENFNLLAALAPGRVDLGVGKAPGGLPLSTRALQGSRDPARKTSFAQQFAELDGYLKQIPPTETSKDSLAAYPVPEIAAGRFLLGASVESAELAARHGWAFVYAGHIHGDETAVATILSAYRDLTGKPALFATAVVAARTDAEAESLVGDVRRFRVETADGQAVNVGSIEQAEDFARQAGATEYRIEERTPGIIRGAPARIHAELERLHQQYGIEEFIIDCPVSESARRLETIGLLAGIARAAAA